MLWSSIIDISSGIKAELISQLKVCHAYALQIGDSKDVDWFYLLFNMASKRKLKICFSVKTTGTGNNRIDNFIKPLIINGDKCFTVYSDGINTIFGNVTQIK